MVPTPLKMIHAIAMIPKKYRLQMESVLGFNGLVYFIFYTIRYKVQVQIL